MSAPARTQALAGLVSSAAEELFLQLRSSSGGSSPAGPAPRAEIDDSTAAAELIDAGIAFRCGADGIKAVDQAAALRLLLERRQTELINAQRRILDGWCRLSSLLPSVVADDHAVGSAAGLRCLNSPDQMMVKVAELCSMARRQLHCIEPEGGLTQVRDRLRTLATRAHRRTIVQLGYLHPAPQRNAGRTGLGEEIRVRPGLPIQLLHADNSVALLSTDRSARTGLLVWAPSMVAMLGDWFDLLWDHPGTVALGAGDTASLTDPQQRVLSLMAHDGDEAIARRLNMSITTVRRHVKSIYTALGVDCRFAAGMAAAKRGWI